jgi:hypothetical protein
MVEGEMLLTDGVNFMTLEGRTAILT